MQDIVLKLVQGHKTPVELEQTTYHALAEANIACEKAQIIQNQLKEAIRDLQEVVPDVANEPQ
jgi:hypothetical protein